LVSVWVLWYYSLVYLIIIMRVQDKYVISKLEKLLSSSMGFMPNC
jgi:hypothetical protein